MNKATYTGYASQNFPLSVEGLDFIQNQILLAAEFAKMAGGNYILSGCGVSGTIAASGIMILGGEIIPFAGGTVQATVRVKETASDVTAGSITYSGAYKTRIAEFGNNVSGTDNYNWADLTAFPTVAYLAANKASKDELQEVRDMVMPQGAIILWSGALTAIPAGYALCDGTNGTPNLSGRFVVGYDSASNSVPVNSTDMTENYGKVGNKGGRTSVALVATEMPAHYHLNGISDDQPGSFVYGGVTTDMPGAATQGILNEQNSHNYQGKTNIVGGGQAHENRPPYYVLAYIMKTT